MKATTAIPALVAMAATACAGAPAGGAMHPSAGPDIMAAPGPGVAATMPGPVAVVSRSDATSQEPVCCKLEPKTGSRVVMREVCMTKAQWDDVAKADQDFTQDVQGSAKGKFDLGAQAAVASDA